MVTYPYFENSNHRVAYLSGIVYGTSPKDTVAIAIINERITDIQNGCAPENDDDLEVVTSARRKEQGLRSDSYFVGLPLFTVCTSLAAFAAPWMFELSTMSVLSTTVLLLWTVLAIGIMTTLLSFGVTHYRLKRFWLSNTGTQKYFAKKVELKRSKDFQNKFTTT